jgi:hypothetical protein
MSSIMKKALGLIRSRLVGPRGLLMCLGVGVVAAMSLGGCASSGPPSYETPQIAVDTLIGALRSNNSAQLKEILGPDSDKVLSSGDEVADTNGRAEFLRLFDEKHDLTPEGQEKMILNVGKTEWPCPIPVVKGDKGWFFDTVAGQDELLNRRIGRNELFAIGVCDAIVDAEKEYAAADYDGNGWREYARQFKSDEGKKNGLYWPTQPGEPDSPLGELVAGAKAEGYSGAKASGDVSAPFHGYYYRILTAQGENAPGGAIDLVVQGHMIGGFGVVAWPVEYGNSGLKTFITSHHGVVYEKDLGDDTDKLARAMKAFDPGPGWQVTKDQPQQDPPQPDQSQADQPRP